MSHAQTLLKITRETNQALRDGRLGASEWFAFLNSIEMLAKTMQIQETQEIKNQTKNQMKSQTKIANSNSMNDLPPPTRPLRAANNN